MAKTTRRKARSWKRTLLWVIGIAVVVFILIQFIPYGRTSHTNPAAANPFKWTDPQAKAIAKDSCYDCHSNRTKWWWATDIAPFSWLVQHDVDSGRARLNFSDWAGVPSADEFAHRINDGMPPPQYTLMHSNAKLSDAQKQTLIDGYAASVAAMDRQGGQSSGSTTQSTSTQADAVAAINADCSSCHSSDQALSFRAGSTAEAQALIQDMIQRGARVSAQDAQLMVDYFTGKLSASGGSTAQPTTAATSAAAVIQRDCSSCHPPDPALAFHAGSTAEAQALIQDMIQRGAQVSAQDQQVLEQYFTR